MPYATTLDVLFSPASERLTRASIVERRFIFPVPGISPSQFRNACYRLTMAGTMIRKLTARDARLSSFRFYDLLVHVFVVVLLISNLVGQKICAIPLFNFHGEAITSKISAAQVLYPITNIFGEIFKEVYDFVRSRRRFWLAFFSYAIL